MKIKISLREIILSMTLIFSVCQYGFGQIKGYVSWISDGDTFKAKTDSLGEIKIRIAEIDAPEMSQEYGKESKEFLIKQIWKDSVLLNITGKDQYGRYVAYVFKLKDKSNIVSLMIKQGHAWQFTKYSSDIGLYELQKEAEKTKRGLWANDSTMVPWHHASLEK